LRTIWNEEGCWQHIIRNRRGFRISDELSTALVELKRNEMVEMVRDRIDEGEDPVQVLEECRWSMTIVGERFQEGEYL
jgi:methanogenic corrinoid protein MtbC1